MNNSTPARLTLFGGNNGIYGYSELRDFAISRTTDRRIVLTFDEDEREFDDSEHPFRIIMTLQDAETYTVESGPRAGDTAYSGGSVTSLTFLNRDGDEIGELTNINGSLVLLQAELTDRGQLDHYFSHLIRHGVIATSTAVDPDDFSDFTTSSADDIVRTGGGDAFIKDYGGADRYLGSRDGWDTITYGDFRFGLTGLVQHGIEADLRSGEILGPDGKVDQVRHIDGIRGTFLDDVILGSRGYNEFRGLAGNDYFNGRGGGNQIDYSRDERRGGDDGVRVNLANGTARDGFGSRDTFRNISDVEGSDYDDRFIGSNLDNWFRGRDGADTFEFRGSQFGNDYIDDFDASEGDIVLIKGFDEGDYRVRASDDGNLLLVFNGNSQIEFRDIARSSASDVEDSLIFG